MPINFASRSVVLFFIVSLIMACDATSRYGFNAGTVEAGGESVDDDTNSVETSAESADAETSVNVSGDNSDGSIPIIPDSEGAFELGLLSGDLKIEIENTFIKLGWNNSGDYDYYHLAVSYDDGGVFESIKSEDVKNPIKHKLNISRLHSTIYKVTACSTDTQDNCPGTTDLAHDTKSIQITDYIDQIEANYIKDIGTLGNNAEFGIGVALSDDGETLAVAIGKGDYNANFLEGREIGQASIYKNPIGDFGTSSDFAKAPNGYSVMVVNPTLEKVTDVALSGDGGIVAMVSPNAVIAYTLDDDMS
uniref:hypothetical protein n=1 Tax=uncultured Oceanicoccus sp. TaxID=1706381 RepID=UPI0030DA8ED4